MADSYGKGKSRRKGGKKGPEASEWDYDGYGKGYGGNHNAASMGGAAAGGKPSKDIVHHYPPKEMAADVGYPVRGGQTLLIAYFPWEASEGDIEREFSKFCRVKRVHLVVDKSSRKPRCFGFVKFLSKADAEEALRATTQGLVQLPDTRGHVWHLKAEWTKSGDMVVDDSEAEQEVAKRKEERRSRTDTTPGRGGTSAPPPKGALHPGVPAPLPPLQTRYPPQAAIGMPPPPPLQQSMAHSHAVPPLQQPLPPQGQLYGQHMYGQGQQLYGSQASIYSGLPVPGRDPAALDAPGLPSAAAPPLLRDINSYAQAALDALGLPSAAAPPLLRDINSYAQASQQAYPGAPGYAAAVAAHHAPGYPPQSAQSYVGQQPYGSQQPYVSSQQAAAYSAGQYSGQQAAYAAGQQAYQTAAATASSGYGGAYPPQAQTGYGAPPGYGAQYGQPATAYPTNPTTAYATAGYGLGQSPYNYLQQPSTSASGVVAYGSYQGAQSQVPQAATSQVQYTQPGQTDPSVATGSLADQSQQQYLDMVWQLSDMSLNDKQTLPAPPNQQPPAPPAHMPAEGTAAGASTGVWNSFDDAAAKGMVDGLVGDDAAAAGAPPPLPPPPPNTAMWTSH